MVWKDHPYKLQKAYGLVGWKAFLIIVKDLGWRLAFQKSCLSHFMERKSWNWALGQKLCSAGKASVKGSSSDKTQQCLKVNKRALIIFLLWPQPFFMDRVLICSQWQIRRCEVLARNNINSIQPAAWVSVGVGYMVLFFVFLKKSLWYHNQSSASPNLFFSLRLRTQGKKAGGWDPQWLTYTNGNRMSLVSFP